MPADEYFKIILVRRNKFIFILAGENINLSERLRKSLITPFIPKLNYDISFQPAFTPQVVIVMSTNDTRKIIIFTKQF
jgi:hypothetical protein